MAKYIDSGAFQAALVRKQCGPVNQRYTDGWNDCLLRVKSMVSKAPAPDVAPVVHGRWIKDDFLSDDVNNAEKCSQCGELIGWFGNLPNYCPNCGAKMDGGDGDAKSM